MKLTLVLAIGNAVIASILVGLGLWAGIANLIAAMFFTLVWMGECRLDRIEARRSR